MSNELLGQAINNIIWKEKEKDESDSIAFILFIMIYNFYLIRTCKYDAASRWFTCNHTFTRFFVARNK